MTSVEIHCHLRNIRTQQRGGFILWFFEVMGMQLRVERISVDNATFHL